MFSFTAKTRLYTPTVIAVTLLIIIFLALDFVERFLASQDLESKTVDVLQITALKLPQTSQEKLSLIEQTYQHYQEPVESTEAENENVGMSKEQQAKQQGQLTALFVDDFQLKLKAVINGQNLSDGSAVALVQVNNLKTGEQAIERFNDNSQVYGYQLSINSNTQITLVKMIEQAEQQLEQKVQLIMYKAAN